MQRSAPNPSLATPSHRSLCLDLGPTESHVGNARDGGLCLGFGTTEAHAGNKHNGGLCHDNGTTDYFGGPERASRVNRGSPKQTARTSTEEVTQREAFPSTSSESSSARELASEKFFFGF